MKVRSKHQEIYTPIKELTPVKDMTWERNLSLFLAFLMLVGSVVGAYSFITNSPDLGSRTPAEIDLAETWIRVLLTVLWIGFSLFSIVLMIFLSGIIGKAESIRNQWIRIFKKNQPKQ